MDLFSEEKKDGKNLFDFLRSNRLFLTVGSFLGLCAGIVSFYYQDEKFMSYGIVYPANTYSRDQVISNPQFGHELEAEQLMQLLESRNIRDSVIQQFNLIDYYDLDTSEAAWADELTQQFIDDIQFEKTRYLSIVIKAEMRDPKLSSEIVNYIIEVVDRYKASIFKENIKEELAFLEQQLGNQQKKLKSIKAKIYAIKDTSKAENILENYLLKSSKDKYYESDYINTPYMAKLVDDYKVQKQKYLDWKKDYIGAKEMSKRPVLENYVLDRGVPSYKPISPSLIFNALVGLLAGFVFSVIGLALFKNKE